MQKAFYTYRSTDEEFDKKIQGVLFLNSLLQQLIYSKVKITEFENDPFAMSLEEFENFYNTTAEKYENIGRAPFNLGDFVPAFKEEQQEGEKKEEKEEGIEQTIVIPESYSSLDRKLREENKKKKLESADKVESLQISQSEAPAAAKHAENVKEEKKVVVAEEMPKAVIPKDEPVAVGPVKVESSEVAEPKPEKVSPAPENENVA